MNIYIKKDCLLFVFNANSLFLILGEFFRPGEPWCLGFVMDFFVKVISGFGPVPLFDSLTQLYYLKYEQEEKHNVRSGKEV